MKTARIARMSGETKTTSALADDAVVKDALEDVGVSVGGEDEIRASTQDDPVSGGYNFEDNELITVVPKVDQG